MVTWGPGKATHSQLLTAFKTFYQPTIAYKYKTTNAEQKTLHQNIIMLDQLKYTAQEKSQMLPLPHLSTKQTKSSHTLKQKLFLPTRFYHFSSTFPIVHLKYFSSKAKLVPAISNTIISNRKNSPTPKRSSTKHIELYPIWHFLKNATDLNITGKNYVKHKHFYMLTSHTNLRFSRPSVPEIPIELIESKSSHVHPRKLQTGTIWPIMTHMIKKTFQAQFDFQKTPSTLLPNLKGNQTAEIQQKSFQSKNYENQNFIKVSHYRSQIESSPPQISTVWLAKEATSQAPSIYIQSMLSKETEAHPGIKQYVTQQITPQFESPASSIRSLHNTPNIFVKHPKIITRRKENVEETQSKSSSSIFSQTIKFNLHKNQYKLPTSLNLQATINQLQKGYTQNMKAITPNLLLNKENFKKMDQLNFKRMTSKSVSPTSKISRPSIPILLITTNQKPVIKYSMPYAITKTPSIHEPSYPVLYNIKHLSTRNELLHERLHRLNTYTEINTYTEQTSQNRNKNFTNEMKINQPKINTKTVTEKQIGFKELTAKPNQVPSTILFPVSKPKIFVSPFHKQNNEVQTFINPNYKSIPILKPTNIYDQTAIGIKISIPSRLKSKINPQSAINSNHEILPFLYKVVPYINNQTFSQYNLPTGILHSQSLPSVSANHVNLPQVNTVNTILPVLNSLSYQTPITPKYILSTEIANKLNSKISGSISSNEKTSLSTSNLNFTSKIIKQNSVETPFKEIHKKQAIQIKESLVTLPGTISKILSPTIQILMSSQFKTLFPFRQYITKPLIQTSTVASQGNTPTLKIKAQKSMPETLLNMVSLSTKTISPLKLVRFSSNHSTMPSVISQNEKNFIHQAPNENNTISTLTPKMQESINNMPLKTEKGITTHLMTDIINQATTHPSPKNLSSQENNILKTLNEGITFTNKKISPTQTQAIEKSIKINERHFFPQKSKAAHVSNKGVLRINFPALTLSTKDINNPKDRELPSLITKTIYNANMPVTCTFCNGISSTSATKRLSITNTRTFPTFSTNIKKPTVSSYGKISAEKNSEFSPELTKLLAPAPITHTAYKILLSQITNAKKRMHTLKETNNISVFPTSVFYPESQSNLIQSHEILTSQTKPLKVSNTSTNKKNLPIFSSNTKTSLVYGLNKMNQNNLRQTAKKKLNIAELPIISTNPEINNSPTLPTKKSTDFEPVKITLPLKPSKIINSLNSFSMKFNNKSSSTHKQTYSNNFQTKIPRIKSFIESSKKGLHPATPQKFEITFERQRSSLKPYIESLSKTSYLPIENRETLSEGDFEILLNSNIPFIKHSKEYKISYTPVKNQETVAKENFKIPFKTKPPLIEHSKVFLTKTSYLPIKYKKTLAEENFEIPFKIKTPNIKPTLSSFGKMLYKPIKINERFDEKNFKIPFEITRPRVKLLIESNTKIPYSPSIKLGAKPGQERLKIPLETKKSQSKSFEKSPTKMSRKQMKNIETFHEEYFEFPFETKTLSIKPTIESSSKILYPPTKLWVKPVQEKLEIPLQTKTPTIKLPVKYQTKISYLPIIKKETVGEEIFQIPFKTNIPIIKHSEGSLAKMLYIPMKSNTESLPKIFDLLTKSQVKTGQERFEIPFKTKIPHVHFPVRFFTKLIYLSRKNTQKPQKRNKVIFISNKPNLGLGMHYSVTPSYKIRFPLREINKFLVNENSYEKKYKNITMKYSNTHKNPMTQRQIINLLKYYTQNFDQRSQSEFRTNPKQSHLSKENIQRITPRVLVQPLVSTNYLTEGIGSKSILPNVTRFFGIRYKNSTKGRKQNFPIVPIQQIVAATTVVNDFNFPSISSSKNKVPNMAAPKMNPFVSIFPILKHIPLRNKYSFSQHNHQFPITTSYLEEEKTPQSYEKKTLPLEKTLPPLGKSQLIKGLQITNYRTSHSPRISEKDLNNTIISKAAFKNTDKKMSAKLNKKEGVLKVTKPSQNISKASYKLPVSAKQPIMNMYKTGK